MIFWTEVMSVDKSNQKISEQIQLGMYIHAVIAIHVLACGMW